MAGKLQFTGGGESDLGMAKGTQNDTAPTQPGTNDSGNAVVSPDGAGIPNGRSIGGQVTDKSYDSVGNVPKGGDPVQSPADTITW